MSYPNMSTEVIEAIHYWFKDWPDVQADCYVYLSHMHELSHDLASKALSELEEMGRCPECGALLATYSYKEPHPELGVVGVYENMTGMYCPYCDYGGET